MTTIAALTITTKLVIAIGSGKLDGFVDLLTKTTPRMWVAALGSLLLALLLATGTADDPTQVMATVVLLSGTVRGWQKHHADPAPPTDTDRHGYL